MADYYAILKRAIDGLQEPTGEMRRSVYEKARGALVNQLKSFDPPLSASEITQQRLQLEDAIRKVEAESAKGLLSQALTRVATQDRADRLTGPTAPPTVVTGPVPPPITSAAPPPLPSAGPPPPAGPPVVAAPPPSMTPPSGPSAPPPRLDLPFPDPAIAAEPASSSAKSETGPTAARPMTGSRLAAAKTSTASLTGTSPGVAAVAARMAKPQFESLTRPGATSTSDTAAQPGPMPPPPTGGLPPNAPTPPTGSPKRPTGPAAAAMEQEDTTKPIAARTLKKAVSDIDRLGSATSETAKRARDALAATDAPLDDNLASPGKTGPGTARKDARARKSGTPEPTAMPTQTAAKSSRWPVLIGLSVAMAVVGLGATALYMQRDLIATYLGSRKLPTDPGIRAVVDKPLVKVTDRLVPEDGPGAKPNAQAGVKVVTTQPITAGTDPASPASPGGQSDVAPSSPPVPALPSAPPAANPASPPVPAPATDASAPAPLAATGEIPPIAQRVSLLEEGATGLSQPVSSIGRVVWQAVKEPAGQPGKPDVTRIRGKIEIPDRKILLMLTIEPNLDATLPASHLIKLEFKLPEGFDNKAVAKVPGVIMRQSEATKGGDALAAVPAKVTNSVFWIALSSPDGDRTKNLQLLKDRGWIDIPFFYENGRRAMLTIEKAGAGDRVFSDAIGAWSNGG